MSWFFYVTTALQLYEKSTENITIKSIPFLLANELLKTGEGKNAQTEK